jgi:hypothetical protein
MPVDVAPAGRDGVGVWVKLEHYASARVDDLAGSPSENRYAGVLVEGPGFTSPSDVYVVGLRLENRTASPLPLPDLCLAGEGGAEGRLRPKASSIPPGGKVELSFLWNPAAPVSRPRARLDWPR